VRTSRLGDLPLTGLTRKALQRLDVMAIKLPKLPDPTRPLVRNLLHAR
jgi:A/G-specific adenine glycosylase